MSGSEKPGGEGSRAGDRATPPAMPRIAGIVNLSEDSFSDGGLHLDPRRALARARELVTAGADLIDLGPASTRPGAKPVSPREEISRLEPVVDELLAGGVTLSIDTFQPETQLWALARGVALLNDVQGFPHPEVYPALAGGSCALVVMHSVQRLGPATRVETDTARVVRGIAEFFDARIAALESAGIARTRLILDPGMGFFLGRHPEVSLEVLSALGALRRRYELPVWICVSRKSFLGQLTGREVAARGAATLAAEIFAAERGVDYVRTHDVAALRDALLVWRALSARAGAAGGPRPHRCPAQICSEPVRTRYAKRERCSSSRTAWIRPSARRTASRKRSALWTRSAAPSAARAAS
jgi:dihydropteroate synthase type 2